MIICLLLSIILVFIGFRIGIDVFAKYLYDNYKIDKDLYFNAITNPEFLLDMFKHFIRK